MKTRKHSLTALAVGALLWIGSLCNTARAQGGGSYGLSHDASEPSWSDVRSDFAASMPHRDDYQVYMAEPFASLPNLKPEAYFDVAAPEPSTALLLALAIPLLVPLKFLRRKSALRPVRIIARPIHKCSPQLS
jgi:hypothetical protein